MKKNLLLGITTIALSLAGIIWSNSAKGAVINYNEAIDGDLPTFAADSPLFNLGIGENTFTGETTFSNNTSIGSSDFDSFTFQIPNEASLESILLNISLLPIGSGAFSNTTYTLQDSSFSNISAEESVTIPSINLSLSSTDLPLGSGQFAIQQNSLSGSLAPGEFRTAAYTFSLNIEGQTTPEPFSVLSFFIIGTTLAFNSKLKFKG